MTHETAFRISLAQATPRERGRLEEVLASRHAPDRGTDPAAPEADERHPWIEGDVLVIPVAGAMETFATLAASDDLRALAVAFRLLEEIERRDAGQDGDLRSSAPWRALAEALRSRCPRPPAPATPPDDASRRTMTSVASSDQGAPAPKSVA